MADNTVLNSGSGGDTLRTDDVGGGVKVATSKITLGADGTDGGFVSSANPLPVSDASGSLTVDAPVGTPVFVRLSDGSAAISTLPVSLASVPSHAVTNAGTFAVQASQAGTWTVQPGDTQNTTPWLVSDADALGSLQSIQAVFVREDSAHANTAYGVMGLSVRKDTAAATAGTDGDYQPLVTDDTGRLWCRVSNTVTVDGSGVTQPVSDAGGSLTIDNAALSVTGGGVEASALRVTIANDSTGLVSVDDNGGSLTVDGTVTANAGTNLNTSALALESGGNLAAAATSLAALDNAVSGNELQVDVVTLPNVTNAGTFAVQPLPSTTGGLSVHKSLDLDESEEEVKSAAGCVYGMWVTNRASSTRYIKFYNATAANTTVGTTTPLITIGIPGNATDHIAGNFGPGGMGITFDTAISVAATTGFADNDTGAPSANDCIVAVFYK